MEIKVHGKNVQVTDALRELAETKVSHGARFFDGQVGLTDVEFHAESNPRLNSNRHRVEITSGVAHHIVRVEASAHEQQAALDLAVDKFERQLRRLKERLIGRARRADRKLRAQAVASEDEPDPDATRQIVRVKQFTMKPMSPEEAALQLELLGHSFFFFLNSDSDEHAVLYRRRDGQLGLIEAS